MDTCCMNVTVDYPQAVQVINGCAELPENVHDFLSWKVNIWEWFPGRNMFRWLCVEHQRLNFFKHDGWLKQTKNIWMLNLVELGCKF